MSFLYCLYGIFSHSYFSTSLYVIASREAAWTA